MLAKEAVQPFSRYADLLTIVGFLPVLGYVKFGHILQQKKLYQEHQRKKRKEEKETKAKAKSKSEGTVRSTEDEKEASSDWTPTADPGLAEGVPPLLALVLLLLAEVFASAQIFDPSNLQVRRAVGVVGRSRKNINSDAGFMKIVEAIVKLLEDNDVYEVTRFFSLTCILSSLVVVLIMNMPRDLENRNPFWSSFLTIKRFIAIVFRPVPWLLAIISICFIAGNPAGLGKALKRPATMELLNSLAYLFRAIAAAVMATGVSYDGELPFWCMTQAVATIARASYIFGYERVEWSSLWKASISASAASVRVAFVLQAFTALAFIPCIMRKQRLMLLLLLLCVPCMAVFDDGHLRKALEPFLSAPILMQNSSMVLGVMSLMALFMSGIPGVFSLLTLIQAMFIIHKLETVKI